MCHVPRAWHPLISSCAGGRHDGSLRVDLRADGGPGLHTDSPRACGHRRGGVARHRAPVGACGSHELVECGVATGPARRTLRRRPTACRRANVFDDRTSGGGGSVAARGTAPASCSQWWDCEMTAALEASPYSGLLIRSLQHERVTDSVAQRELDEQRGVGVDVLDLQSISPRSKVMLQPNIHGAR